MVRNARVSAMLAILMVALVSASPGLAVEQTIAQLSEPPGSHLSTECHLNYHYYVPCPTKSYFWSWHGWDYGDILGQFFLIGDQSMGSDPIPCDPTICHRLAWRIYLTCDGPTVLQPTTWGQIKSMYR